MVGSTGTAALKMLAIGIVGYYTCWAVVHLAITVVGARTLRRRAASGQAVARSQPMTIAVPAYDEADTVLAALEALFGQSVPLSVVFVDDGSTDGTFERVDERFALRRVEQKESSVDSFEAADYPLCVVRQANAGKVTALNRALDRCETPLFGVVDADTVLERGALAALAAAFEDSETVAAGGSLRVADAASLTEGATSAGLPSSWFQRFQALDQLRAFVMRQLGRDSVGMMVHVFGACSLYRTEAVRAVGGFSESETEDFDLTVALRRHCAEAGRPCKLVHVPSAIAWTTVPDTAAALDEQRRRWVRGATETLATHRSIVGRPRYGRGGLLGLPYFLFGEVLWPITETLGYVVVPVAWLLGAVSLAVPATFIAGLLVAGPIASWVAVRATRAIDGGYDAEERRALRSVTVVERVLWRPVQAFLGTVSVFDYFRR